MIKYNVLLCLKFGLDGSEKKMVTEGVEPSTVALLAQRSNRLSYATFLIPIGLSGQNNNLTECLRSG